MIDRSRWPFPDGDVPAQTVAVVERLRSSDTVIGNLEMPLSERGYRVRKHSSLRSSPSVIDVVKAMGIGAVSLANNHMMDFGPEALADTIETVDGAGLGRAGAGTDLDEAFLPAVLTVGEMRVGMLSFACTLPVESDAGTGKPGIAPIRVGTAFEVDASLIAEQPGTMPVVQTWTDPDDRARAADAVARLRQDVDLVLIMVHWGVPSWWLSPSQGSLAAYQQPLGHAMIDAGADAICGHHPHALHPIEVYRGKPIFYSLGNFLFEGQYPFMEPESVIAEYDVGPDAWSLVPLRLDPDGFPTMATGEHAEKVLTKLRDLSLVFGDSIRIQDGVATLAREPL